MSHRTWQAALFALAMGGCVQTASQQNLGFGGPEDMTATLSVDNQYFGQVSVYVFNGSSRLRLGSVMAMGTEDFDVPDEWVGMSVQLQADPLTPGAGFTSQHLIISPGSNVMLRLANDLPLSNYSIR